MLQQIEDDTGDRGAPARVPIISPSTGVKHMVASDAGAPLDCAHAGAVPEMRDDQLCPERNREPPVTVTETIYSMCRKGRGSHSAASLAGQIARQAELLAERRSGQWKAVSEQPTCGASGAAALMARIAAQLLSRRPRHRRPGERAIGGGLEHREFDARRIGIDDEDWFIHRFQISSGARKISCCILIGIAELILEPQLTEGYPESVGLFFNRVE